MTIHTQTAVLDGYGVKPVTIEGDSNRGLPRVEIIGLANKIIEESRSRIRSALINSGFAFPQEHIIINLAPAEIHKTGPHLDLAIAAVLLALSRQLLPQDLDQTMFLGELGLNGEIKPIRGIISLLDYANDRHFKTIYIPSKNTKEAQLLDTKSQIIPINNLQELWQNIKNITHISPLKQNVKITETEIKSNIFDQIIGQDHAKRALTIAIAGRHNLLMSGPPGSGKTALAKCALSLLPPLTTKERIEITKLNSLISSNNSLAISRPFRSPHNTASRNAILGGGHQLLPGEISLATHGILFLDELPEFRRDVLEALRQPLEDKKIVLSHTGHSATYPCNFLLLATANPCPCGYRNSQNRTCICTPQQLQRYRQKFSGPLLDRIDMQIVVNQQPTSVLVNSTTSGKYEHETAKSKITQALAAQVKRFGKDKYNANLNSFETSKLIKLNSTRDFLARCTRELQLSARAFFKLIRIARTIADIDAAPEILPSHFAEALQYRQAF